MEDKYYLAKWLEGSLSDEELRVFQETPEYATYSKIKDYSAQLTIPDFDQNLLYQNILKNKEKTTKTISLYKNWILKIAAVLILGIGIGVSYINFSEQKQTALNQQKITFSLPDLSQVILNSGSVITFKKWNWQNNRKLNLQGEAYFKVAKGKKFEVHTALGKVTVLGTQFDVKARELRLEVTCFEGKVKVNYQNTQMFLTHGQSVIFENGKQMNTLINNTTPEWIQHKIQFTNEKLSAIIKEIERQYNVSIENKATNKELFTGKIPSDNLEVALRIIATTYHLKYIKENPNKIIFEKK